MAVSPNKTDPPGRSGPLRPLTMYLFDHKITDIDTGRLHVRGERQHMVDVDVGAGAQSLLYVPAPTNSPPPWASLFQGVAKIDTSPFVNQSCRALLMISVAGRVFALTFGHAKHLFSYDRIERSFGLRVVINAVPTEQLHSIDMRQFERLSMHTLKHTVDEEPLKNFGVNWTKDILRAVTGKPTDGEFAVKASGADPLVLRTRYALSDIPGLCEQALAYFRSRAYAKTQFRYIDWFQPETDSEIVDELDGKMCKAIASLDDTNRPSVAVDGIVDSGEEWVARFVSASRAHHEIPLSIEPIRNYILQREDVDHVSLLKRGRVFRKEGEVTASDEIGRVYDALTWSYRDGKQRQYLFCSGSWLRIEREYAERLEEGIKFISEPHVRLPPALGTNEDRYIELVCDGNDDLLSLQGVIPKGEGMNFGVEACDILGSDRTLYCIKSGNKSSKLSHLFGQGRGAGNALLTNRGYRSDLRARIVAVAERAGRIGLSGYYRDLISDSLFDPSDYEICFCIIKTRTKKWPLCIPYLSQISLYEAYYFLVAAGYRVTLQCIELVKAKGPPDSVPIVRRRADSVAAHVAAKP